MYGRELQSSSVVEECEDLSLIIWTDPILTPDRLLSTSDIEFQFVMRECLALCCRVMVMMGVSVCKISTETPHIFICTSSLQYN